MSIFKIFTPHKQTILLYFFIFFSSILVSQTNPFYERPADDSEINELKNKELIEIPERYKLHPEYGKTKLENPDNQDSYELIHERTVDSRLFQNLDGGFTLVKSGQPMHYIDDQGWWRTIEKEFEEDDVKPQLFHMKKQAQPISFDARTAYITMSLNETGQSISYGKSRSFTQFDSNWNKITERTSNTFLANVNKADALAEVNEIFPGIDMNFTFNSSQVKTNYTISSSNLINSASQWVVFSEEIEIPYGFELTYADAMSSGSDVFFGDLIVKNSLGNETARINQPVFSDSGNDRATNNIEGAYKLTQTGPNTYLIYVVIPTSWLLDPARIYPVVIDPSVSTSSSAIINTCFYPTYQSSSLSITVPIGIITNTYLRWDFIAVDATVGWLEDQRSYVSGPSGSTGIFYGTGTYGGLQTYTTNSTIANGSSTGGNINFTFYASRVWGGSGCNTTYNYLNYRYIEVTYYATVCNNFQNHHSNVNGTGYAPCGSWSYTNTIGPGQHQLHYAFYGSSYSINTCGTNATPSFDTQITAYQGGSTVVYYNDDGSNACTDNGFASGYLDSWVDWTAPFNGWVQIQITRYNCYSWSAGVGSAILRVRENPPPQPSAPTIDPPGGTYCAGANVLLEVVGNPPVGVTWYWQTSATGTSTVNSGSTYSATTTGTYYVRPRTASGCWGTASPGVTATFFPGISNNSISANQTICSGNSPSTLIGSSPSGGLGAGTYNYGWQISTDGGFTWVDAPAPNTGINYSPINLTTTTRYKRWIQSGPCPASESNVVIITVEPTIDGGTVASNQSICYNTTPATFTGTSASGGNGTYAYQWQQQPACSGAWSNITGATAITYNYTGNLTQTTCYRRWVSSGVCPGTNSNSITVTVYPDLTPGSVATNQSICYNTSPSAFTSTTLPSGGTGSYNYQWQQQPLCSGGWADITGATATTYNYTGNLTQTTCYRRRVMSGSCGPVYSNTIIVTVHGNLTPGIVGSNQSICYNTSPAAFTNIAMPSGGTGALDLQWQLQPGCTGAWSNISGATASTYNYSSNLIQTTCFRRRVTNTCGIDYSNTIQVTVYPSLSGGAVGNDQTIFYNTSPAAFTSISSPTGGTGPFTYQWQIQPGCSGAWSNISGATSSTYDETGNLTQNTCYKRIAINSCGNSSSNTVTVTVFGSVTGGTIGNNQTICYNTTPATFINITSPSGGSGSYTYQWQIQPSCSGAWSNISGATSDIYTHTSPLTQNTCFLRIATSGGQSAISNTITVTVYSNLVAGSVASNQTICYNTSPAAFTSSSLPTGGTGTYTYQWQTQPGCSGGWSNISGATASTYNYTGNLTQSTCYRRVETSGTCGSVFSNIINVTVHGNLSAGTVAANQTICYNTSPAAFTNSVSPSGGTGTYTYQWQQQANCTGAWSNISGATTSTYDVTGNLTQTTCYSRVVTSSPCGSTNSNTITVTVNSNLSGGSIGSNQTICYNTTPASFTNTSSPSGGTGTFTYQWQIQPGCSGAWSNISGATSDIYSHSTPLTQNTCFIRIVTSGSCGSANSNTLTITVYPNLVAGSVAANQTICYNTSPAAFTSTSLPTGGTGTYTYQWQTQPGCSGGWSNISGATASTYNYTGNLTQSTCYRRVETSGTCGSVFSNIINVTVHGNLSAGTVATNQTICYNTSPAAFTNSVSPSGGTGTYTYQWQQQANCSGAWSNISGATASTYDVTGNLTQTTCYNRVVTSSPCGSANSNTITVTVYPNLSAGTITASQTICYNQVPAGFSSSSNASGGSGVYTYQWQIQPGCSGAWQDIPGANSNIFSYTSPLTQNTCFRRVVSNVCGTLNSNTLTITVNPLPTVSFSGLAGPYCIDQISPVPLVGSPPGGTFSGNGISGNNFIPYYATVGSNLITYTYTDGNVCTNSTSQYVTVIGLPIVNFTGLAATYCVNQSTPVTLIGFPTGGTFSGPGISGNTFIPSLAGAGVHTITYIYSDANGCTSSKSHTTQVIALPALTFSGLAPHYCINSSPVSLSGFPAGGTFTGNGISGNTFNPTNAGPGNHTITYTYLDVNGCSNFIQQTTNVHNLPVVSFSGLNTNYCQDASGTLLTGSPTGGVFSGIGISGNTFYPIIAGQGNHTITYTYSDGYNCSNFSSQVTNVYAPFLPGSVGNNQTICYNSTPAAFTNTSSPSGGTGTYTYQWQQQPNCTGAWSNISGATSSTLNYSGNLTQTTCFRRQVSNPCGILTSNTIEISVYQSLTSGSISADQTICYNTSPAAFSNITSPSGGNGTYTYQWQQQPGCSGAWSNISTATASTYSVAANLTQTTCYRRIAFSGSCGSAISNSITVTVHGNLTPGSVAANQTICYNALPAPFTNLTSPTGGTGTFSYQWQIQANCSGAWSNITGANSDMYAHTTTLTQNTCFRRVVTSGSCGSANSNTLSVTVYADLTAGSVGSNQTICYNTSPAAFTNITSPTGGNGTFTYQWQVQPACTGGWSDISGATASTYDVTGNITSNSCYRRIVTSGSCGSAISNSINVTVYNDITAGSVGNDQTICYNTSPAAFSNITSPSGGNGTYTYQWQQQPGCSGAWSNISTATASTYSIAANLTQTTCYRRIAFSGSCGSAISNSITVTVHGNLTPGSVAA
ncbi:MAG: hypothetical protein PHT69_04600, partial [Bacteroidales bacterium]|nr:hypothetical protein [Bacteroidales bacterium]